MPTFTCESCNKDFTIKDDTLAKFPGWKPKRCMKCKKSTSTNGSREENLTTAEVLEKYASGPTTGVFTDGSAEPNPGPGGWGAVYVVNNNVISEAHGHKPHTTNNQMELTALIEGTKLVPYGTPATLLSDSNLCVQSMNEWAHNWKEKGWKKKGGPIKNLELVRELFEILQERPELEIKWIRSHEGSRWNEYADSLSTAYRRGRK
jgi:ribonuclease HI